MVWNVKEGWEPLCKFLNVPVPACDLPHLNKGLDMKFLNSLRQSKFWIYNEKCFRRNLRNFVLKWTLISGVVGYEVVSSFDLSKKILMHFRNLISESKSEVLE